MINEPELVGFTPTPEQVQQSAAAAAVSYTMEEDAGYRRDVNRLHSASRTGTYMDSDELDHSRHLRHHHSDRMSPMAQHHSQHHQHHHLHKGIKTFLKLN